MTIRRTSHAAAAALLFAACGDGGGSDDTGGGTGPVVAPVLSVSVSTTGRPLDRDGYTLRLGGDSVGHVGVDGTFTVPRPRAGTHALVLDGVRHNCSVEGGVSRTVELRAGATVNVTLAVTCAPTDVAFIARPGLDGPLGLYVKRGTSEPQLLVSPVQGSRVTWSPDGHKIAYTAPIGTGYHMWYIDVDSMKRVEVVAQGKSAHPNWSPDGQRLVFMTPSGDTYADIWTIRLDGTQAVKLTPEAGVSEMMPAWSPDGSRIAYMRWVGTDFAGMQIWTMIADGSDARFVTEMCCGLYNTFAWSRDGTRIIFSAADPDDRWAPGAYQIYSVNRDGSNRVKITSDSLSLWTPATLSDGRIGFDRNGEIWTMNADGSDVRNVSNTQNIVELGPVWQ